MINFVMNNELKQVSRFLLQLQIHSDEDLDRAVIYAEELTSVFEEGNTEVESLLDFILREIEKYEDKKFPIDESSPVEVLRFLMDQHDHKQKDLSDIATKSVISEILSGKRNLNKNQIEKLSKKYRTSPAVFF